MQAAHENVCPFFGVFCIFKKLNMKYKVQVNQLRGKASYGVFLETLRGIVFLLVSFLEVYHPGSSAGALIKRREMLAGVLQVYCSSPYT